MSNLMEELEKKRIMVGMGFNPAYSVRDVKKAISSAREELTKFFDECSYLSHEQRYKVSCKIDEVLGDGK